MSKTVIDEATVALVLNALEPFITPNWAGRGVDEANAAYTALQGALAEQALAHCEAGPDGCQQCHKEAFEDRSLALAAAVRYVKNNTPNLVWAEINRALAAPQAQPAPVQGWKMVPLQPTDQMRDAGNVIIGDRGALFAAYHAMLAAAPQAPKEST